MTLQDIYERYEPYGFIIIAAYAQDNTRAVPDTGAIEAVLPTPCP